MTDSTDNVHRSPRDTALPGKYVDLIRDGIPAAEFGAKGRSALFSALVSTAMSAQIRGWDEQAWVSLILEPKSRLGYQVRMRDAEHSVSPVQVQKRLTAAWERAWEYRTEANVRDAATVALDARGRAGMVAMAVADPDVDLTDNERAVLAYAVERVSTSGWLAVAMPRTAIEEATDLGNNPVRTALKNLERKGLLFTETRGAAAKNPKYRRATTYTFPEPAALAAYIADLTTTTEDPAMDNVHTLTPRPAAAPSVDWTAVLATAENLTAAATAEIAKAAPVVEAMTGTDDDAPMAQVIAFRPRGAK